MNTKRLVVALPLAIVSSLALPQAAQSAANDWTGAYIGAHAGYGWDSSVELEFAGGASSQSFDMNGYVAGIQGGTHWASRNVVYGVAVDLSVADLDGDAPCPPPGGTCSATIDQLTTIQGRIGVPVSNVLLYGTLGGAIAQIEAKRDAASDTSHETGWVVGLGGAVAFTKSWNGMAELQYIDLGNNDFTLGANSVSVDNTLITMKFGANYRF